MFSYELSCCGFKFCCSHLNFRFRACFEQRVPWHSGNYRVWISSETRTWHDKNIQSNAPYRQIFTIQLNHLKSRPVWLNSWAFAYELSGYELSGCGFVSRCSHLRTGFRSMMGEVRLNALSLVSVYRDNFLDYDKMIDINASKYPRRIIL